ncbi:MULTISPECIES: rhodanese-like domain-containing protein [Metabacillus]|uniref:rhodanese-like domain-containing protein n=1 Tax=Metabacillus TaxID=2675233 RepID=UPI000EF5C65E|nr:MULTISPECIES: rhodanese-like domain-containing protein [Metabacillus]MCM3162761.1 rhodanese-like domain-containing protein [Metabacillus litoralis]MCM3410929.1 rhodanese-like domain-containing protein [Metabacillus litoralis]UGB29869.1 rhodanese-like domain-containing protein [Metabacillus sp. B2-18]UHA62155.1 rhodanese-like domain-containing protein [Metabacillus litoralis]
MSEFKEISPEEVQKRLENGEKLELIDVREDEEVEAGMIPQAKHIRMNDIPEHLDALDKDKETIYICRSGGRSGNVCAYLQDKGYDVVNMTGGMLDYKGETKPKSQLA